MSGKFITKFIPPGGEEENMHTVQKYCLYTALLANAKQAAADIARIFPKVCASCCRAFEPVKVPSSFR
jgi:hypothetical protein